MRRALAHRTWFRPLLLAMVAMAGCTKSTAESQPCTSDPLSCPSGETCWPAPCECPDSGNCTLTTCAPTLACVPSAAGKSAGDLCASVVGIATCGDRQVCVQGTSDGGTCRAYCAPDAGAGCSAGESCTALDLLGPSDPKGGTIAVCLPPG